MVVRMVVRVALFQRNSGQGRNFLRLDALGTILKASDSFEGGCVMRLN